MNKREIRDLLADVSVLKPCGVDWNTMTGDEQVRVCSQCNLNVHNLSAMNALEAATLVKRRKTERVCVYFKRNLDGSVKVDNCPQQIKSLRTKVFCAAAASLMCIALSVHFSSTSTITELAAYFAPQQPGAPIDPRYGQTSDNVDPRYGIAYVPFSLSNITYDMARVIADSITFVSTLIAIFCTFKISKNASLSEKILARFALTVVPALVHLAGQFVTNQMGGLGGGM